MTNNKKSSDQRMPTGIETTSTARKDAEEMTIPATLLPVPTEKTYLTPEEKAEIDSRSVFVGNVDYSVTAQELGEFFHGCGPVKRVTIPVDKYSGNPKGFAYVEFAEKFGAHKALAMANALLKGRQIKVSQKRTNKPGISTTNRMPRNGFHAGTTSGGVAVGHVYPVGILSSAPGMMEAPNFFMNNLA